MARVTGSHVRSALWLGVCLVLVGASAYGLIRTFFDETESAIAQQGGPPSLEELAAFKAKRDADLNADRAKPRFTGKLGDFIVVEKSEDADPALLYCENAAARGIADGFRQSELSQGSVREQSLCATGEVAASFSNVGRLSYFRESPTISAQAPADRVKLITVVGRPALLVEPPVTPGPHFLYVIKRQPSGDSPGILAAVIGRDGFDSAVQLATQLLGQ